MIKFEESKRQDIGIETSKKLQIIRVGNLKEQKIDVTAQEICKIGILNPTKNQEISITGFVGGSINADIYEGTYSATPRIHEQKIPTKNKLLLDDIKVEKIPITSVSNTSGGKTVIIGG